MYGAASLDIGRTMDLFDEEVVWVMRAGFAILLTLVLALPGGGQGAAPTGALLSEGTGDVSITTVGTPPQASPDAHFKALDLTALTITETDEAFQFGVQVAGLDQAPEVPLADDGIYYVTFTHQDQDYRITIFRALGEQSFYWAYLSKFDPSGQFNFQKDLGVTPDPAAGTMTTEVRRDDLVDTNGAAPFPGRTLSKIWVESHLGTHDGFLRINDVDIGKNYDASDRMPNTGYGETAFVVKLGLMQSGHAVLSSPDPFRASNGEQATFVFNMTGRNTGTAEEVFVLSATNVPAGWTITLPASTVRIAPGASQALPVLVSTPFSHTHGVLKKFRMEMQSEADPGTVGRLDMGIRYFAVPQPAGHHSTLYLHSSTYGSKSPLQPAVELGLSGNSGFSYMNTLIDDPEDAKIPITAWFSGYYCDQACPPPLTQWRWYAGLQPSLEMGLDFDLTHNVDFQLPIVSRVPIPQAIMSGTLYHEAYDTAKGEWHETVLASFGATEPRDLSANVPSLFQWTVAPAKQSDYLPYAQRAYVTLQLNMGDQARLRQALAQRLHRCRGPHDCPGGRLAVAALRIPGCGF